MRQFFRIAASPHSLRVVKYTAERYKSAGCELLFLTIKLRAGVGQFQFEPLCRREQSDRPQAKSRTWSVE